MGSFCFGMLHFCGLALVCFGVTVVRLAFLCTTRGWLAVYLLWTGANNSRMPLRPGRPNFMRWRLIFATPVRNLLHFTRLESRILRWLLGYRKICALLAVGVTLRTYSKFSKWCFLFSSNTNDLVQAFMDYLSLVL